MALLWSGDDEGNLGFRRPCWYSFEALQALQVQCFGTARHDLGASSRGSRGSTENSDGTDRGLVYGGTLTVCVARCATAAFAESSVLGLGAGSKFKSLSPSVSLCDLTDQALFGLSRGPDGGSKLCVEVEAALQPVPASALSR